jgi:REP element-mobilizing transposase RayT
MRKTKFQNEHYYHLFNRGVDKRDIFMDDGDYLRFLLNMRELNNESTKDQRRNDKERASNSKLSLGVPKLSLEFLEMPNLASFIAYCLSPNHYHFLLKQNQENGISNFMHKFSTGYTKYFNEKHNRSGSLFQGPFKAVEIKTDSQLHYVSAYINGNSEIHKIAKAESYKYSSYLDYLNKRQGMLCNKSIILDDFESVRDYKKYVEWVIKNSSEIKKEIKECLIEL